MRYCLLCHGPLVLLGTLGNLKWFRCRNCGMGQCNRAKRKDDVLYLTDEDSDEED